jgi:heptaprenyl diphosphate synthase
VLSLSGAILSLAVLALGMYLPRRYFSAVTLSILAAFGHIIGQLLVVRFWLIPHAGIAYLIPLFALAALFFGLINGVITAKILSKSP